jgi:PAS domain S-box-containing protein
MNSVGASVSNPVGLVFREWRLTAIVPALLLVCCACAFALDPSLDISQYAHTAWKVRDGFTRGANYSIAQTPDGYLWLGTEFGLVRFDGVRAVPWHPPEGQHLPGDRIYNLLVSRDGTLWIGTTKGLAGWKDNKLTRFPKLDGEAIFAVLEDRDGTVWVGAGTGNPGSGKLCAVQGSNVECFGGDGHFGYSIIALYEDRKGNLWAGVSEGLWRWKPGPPRFYPLPGELNGIQALSEDEAGALLVGWKGGIYRFIDGKMERYASVSRRFQAKAMFRDGNAGLWIATWNQGLLHVHDGKSDAFSARDGLSGDDVYRLFEDREGNVWVPTIGGLDRFRDYAVATLRTEQGLSRNLVGSMLADRDGSVWLATYGGLNRWDKGQITIPQVDGVVRDGTVIRSVPNSLFQDNGGRIWLSTADEVGYMEKGHFTSMKGVPSGAVYSFVQDSDSNLWVANDTHGLVRISPRNGVRQIPWADMRHKDYASVLAADRKSGGFWIGFLQGGIASFSDGQVRTSYTTADGLGSGRVSDLLFDREDTLWISTEGGLSRLKNNRLATMTSKNGLPCDTVHWAIEDDDHSMWLYTACGLLRIVRSELDAWSAAADKQDETAHKIQVTVFDSSDGVRSLAIPGHYHPQVAKTPDGKLWFLPWDGVSVIDPRHLAFNKLPPPVHIEQINADGKTFDVSQEPRLPALVRDLAIDYTALSLVVPEKVHFRFKLEGQDKDWREVVNVRHVQYSNLPPRHYRFRVIAANNSGVWNETGDSLDFDIPPAWYQTMWFRAICIAAFMILLWAVYQLRVHQLQEQEKKFRDAVETMRALAFVVDPNGTRTFWNKGWLEYTGMSPEQASGSGWEKAIHPDDLNRVLERWRTSQKTGQHLDYELRLRRGSDGIYRWFQVRARPLRDRQGKIVKWCAVASDIEDRKQAERLQVDLTHANRVSTMGELVASISHELAQPITVTTAHARASLRWLQHDPPELTEVRLGTEKIVEAGAMAAEIIDRLRSLYIKAPPKRELVAMNEVIAEMAGMLRSEARGHGVSIRTDLKDDIPMTMADRVQLQQVLMNLILNGIEAMSETGGVLTVKSKLSEDSEIQISVNDTGPGLPPGKADQIFEAFFTTKPQGSGMGLAICKSIVEAHGGRIWANGNGGLGSAFHFTLPANPAKNQLPSNAV